MKLLDRWLGRSDRELAIASFTSFADTTLLNNGIEKQIYRDQIIAGLLALYTSPDRFYHTVEHIVRIVQSRDEYFPEGLEPAENLAILFHDAIFVPGQKGNEEKSVDYMIGVMRGFGVPVHEASWASRCIYATGNHLGYEPDESTHTVLDLDLVSLAAPWEDFSDDSEAVLKEFPTASPLERAGFLMGFLEKKNIFYKLTHLQARAVSNIETYKMLLEAEEGIESDEY